MKLTKKQVEQLAEKWGLDILKGITESMDKQENTFSTVGYLQGRLLELSGNSPVHSLKSAPRALQVEDERDEYYND